MLAVPPWGSRWPAEGDADIIDWVQSIGIDVSGVFGDELVEVYFHGSLAIGCYYRPKSDLDLLIVCSGAPGVVGRERAAATLCRAGYCSVPDSI